MWPATAWTAKTQAYPLQIRMTPPVPSLASADVQSYTDGQLKWVIDNGVAPSGMPGSKGILPAMTSSGQLLFSWGIFRQPAAWASRRCASNARQTGDRAHMNRRLARGIIDTFVVDDVATIRKFFAPFDERDWMRSMKWFDTADLRSTFWVAPKRSESEDVVPAQILREPGTGSRREPACAPRTRCSRNS